MFKNSQNVALGLAILESRCLYFSPLDWALAFIHRNTCQGELWWVLTLEEAHSQLIFTIFLVWHWAGLTPKPSMGPHHPRGKAPNPCKVSPLLALFYPPASCTIRTGWDTLSLVPLVCVSPNSSQDTLSAPPARLCSHPSLSCDLQNQAFLCLFSKGHSYPGLYHAIFQYPVISTTSF